MKDKINNDVLDRYKEFQLREDEDDPTDYYAEYGDYEKDKKENKDKKYSYKTSMGVKIYLTIITFLAVILLLSVICIFEKYAKEEKQVIQLVEVENNEDSELKEIIKDYMENGKGVMAMLRELYPENIIVYNSNKYQFLPVIEGIQKNDIDNNNLNVLGNGEIQYLVKDKVKSHKGIDVSKYQGEIDWQKVAADGVEFAMIRLGYRGYGSGALVLDEEAMTNIEGATSAGIKVGVYFFSQAITQEEAREEARFVIENIKQYDIKYPVVFDTEEILNEEARTEGLTVDELTDIAIAFCEEVEEQGYKSAIYANLRWFALSLDMSRLDKYYKWYAYYDKNLYFPYKINMWQYSENGTVDGITGSVDMNISFEDWD
jgi:GH25 family lysozyme M1 (1,4-beta-N-acetylmuramidase)